MSVLEMILMATVVVPRDVPEKVSDEVAETRQSELSGEWEGIAYGGSSWLVGRLRLAGGFIHLQRDVKELHGYRIVLEREGRLSIRINGSIPYPGIYEWNGHNLWICFHNNPWSPRPTSCCASDDRHLLILHRAKPRK